MAQMELTAERTNGVFPASAGALETPSGTADSLLQCKNAVPEPGGGSRSPGSSEEDGKSTSASSSDSRAPRKRVRKPRKATNTMRRVRLLCVVLRNGTQLTELNANRKRSQSFSSSWIDFRRN